MESDDEEEETVKSDMEKVNSTISTEFQTLRKDLVSVV